MLQKIRDRFSGAFAITLLALLCVPFVFFGINYDFIGSSYAAKVDDVEISMAELQDAYQRALAQYAEADADLSPQVHNLIRQSVLSNLIRNTLVNLYLSKEGYSVSNQMVTDLIRKVPEFQADGKFSKELYYSWLDGHGLNYRQFEEGRRQAMRLDQLQRGIVATAFVTPAEYRRFLNLYGEQRRAAVATFEVATVAETVELSDDEISAWYSAHPEEFQAEESADIAFLEIDRGELARNATITDDALHKYYEQVSNRFVQDEGRQAHHILIPFGDDEEAAKQKATSIAARARAGEPFEDLARQYSADSGSAKKGGDLGTVLKSQMPGALGDAIFSMSEGEIAGPVKSDFGFHIVRLDKIVPGGPLPFDQVRQELAKELRDKDADAAYRNLESKLSDALFDSTDLQTIADTVGLKVQTASGFTRSGGEPFGKNQAAIDAIFDPDVLKEGRISDIVELDANRSAVFKVREYHPAVLQPIEKVRDRIVAKLQSERAEEIVRERADTLKAALADGSDFKTAATAAGATVLPATLLRRQDDTTDPQVLEAIFRAAKPGENKPIVGSAKTANGDYAVFSLEAVLPGRPEAIPLEQRDAGKVQLASKAGQDDYAAMVLELERNADIVRSTEALEQPAF